MANDFERRLSAAVPAAWWTLVIAIVWMLCGWLVLLVFLHTRPGWLLWLWGGGNLDWDTMHRISLYFYGAIKVVLLIWLMLTAWLTLWSRRLRRGPGQ